MQAQAVAGSGAVYGHTTTKFWPKKKRSPGCVVSGDLFFVTFFMECLSNVGTRKKGRHDVSFLASFFSCPFFVAVGTGTL